MFTNIIYALIYIAFIFIFIFQLKKDSLTDHNDFSSRINSLRGLFALEIVLGHCTRYDGTILSPFGNFMLISVGFFFFISGFGLAQSFHNKPGYLDTFIKHRFLHLIIISLVALIITTIIAYISPIKTDFTSVPLSSVCVFVQAVFLRTNWYIRELLLFYILFYAIFKLFKKNRIIYIILVQLSLCIPLYFTGHTRCWFASILCFPLGIFSYTYYDKVLAFIKTKKGIALSTIIFITGTVTSLPDYSRRFGLTFEVSELISSFFNNMMCIGFMLIMSYVLSYYRFNNAVLSFFNKLSTELYFFQFVLIAIAEKMQLSTLWKIAFVLTLDIVISFVVHHLIFKKIK